VNERMEPNRAEVGVVCADEVEVGDNLINLGTVTNVTRSGVFVIIEVDEERGRVSSGRIEVRSRTHTFHESSEVGLWL
jgi:hypothetical protein